MSNYYCVIPKPTKKVPIRKVIIELQEIKKGIEASSKELNRRLAITETEEINSWRIARGLKPYPVPYRKY